MSCPHLRRGCLLVLLPSPPGAADHNTRARRLRKNGLRSRRFKALIHMLEHAPRPPYICGMFGQLSIRPTSIRTNGTFRLLNNPGPPTYTDMFQLLNNPTTILPLLCIPEPPTPTCVNSRPTADNLSPPTKFNIRRRTYTLPPSAIRTRTPNLSCPIDIELTRTKVP
ncbi:hypothetical protein BYT27DRAFT_7256958 [Phlegmacium glaucopus]|nr:hypothetical protein BYT27DRAFT_7256958 [Phlegmacium glaucopus]